MKMDHAAFLKAFLGLFAMMNPIGNTGIFIGMTGDLPASFKLKVNLYCKNIENRKITFFFNVKICTYLT